MDGYDVNFLNPGEIIFERAAGGLLTAKIGDKAYKAVVLYRTFPHTMPYEYISVRELDDEDKEIGVIKRIEELEEASKDEAIKELHLRYLLPVVKRIYSTKSEQELWMMKIETDRGPMSLAIQNVHEHIQYTKRGGMLLSDMEGRRCEIRDLEQLDKKSLRELNRMI